MTTREEFLARIRDEVRRSAPRFPASVSERPARAADLAETVRRELGERWPQMLERFRLEFERVGGVFQRVATPAAIPDVVGSLAGERGMSRLITWPAATLGLDLATALAERGLAVEPMPHTEPAGDSERARLSSIVAGADLGVTGVDLAVAETGTLVLVSGAGRPRSTSLLPAVHVAVFDRWALVESLAQVGVFLEAWHAGGAPAGGAVVNFITGPSRTADIELTLTRGVHGPKEVHAIFVEEGLGG